MVSSKEWNKSGPCRTRTKCRRLASLEKLGIGRSAEDLNQTVGDQFILAIFELPDRKTEAIRIARRAMMAGVCISGTPVRIPAAHTGCSGAHATDPKGPGVGQFLQNLLTADAELRPIDFPAIPSSYTVESRFRAPVGYSAGAAPSLRISQWRR